MRRGAGLSLGIAWLAAACGGATTSDPEPLDASGTGGTATGGLGPGAAGAPLAGSGGSGDGGSAGEVSALEACPGLETVEELACGAHRLPWARHVEDDPCVLHLPFELTPQEENAVNVLIDCEFPGAPYEEGVYCSRVVGPDRIQFGGECCDRIERETPFRVDVIMGCFLIR